MEQIYFGARIAAYRKGMGLTQEELARQLGITNQAVSKWESDQSCPDIMLLPDLARVFGVSIDELFGCPAPAQPAVEEQAPVQEGTDESPVYVAELPWPEDNCLRAVCFVGHRLVDSRDILTPEEPRGFHLRLGNLVIGNQDPRDKVELHFSGRVDHIQSAYSVIVEQGDIAGDVSAEDSVSVNGNVGGNVNAGDSVSVGGGVGGNVSAGDDVSCQGSIGGNLTTSGDVECGNVSGNVNADGDVTCGEVCGDVRCEGDVECGRVQGSVYAEGDVSIN